MALCSDILCIYCLLTGWKMGGNLGLEVESFDLKIAPRAGPELGYPGVLPIWASVEY